MQIVKEKRELETSGVDTNTKRKFQIDQNARAFEVLSSNIYSDKILAVVRELSCNAWDAHIEAGNEETPFDVHFPNDFEPWFAIKDYGVGLSDDQVMELYTTYFRSTKTTNNFMTGALGLGSKSPFCYVDQFTVTSRYDGKVRSYTAFIDEEGAPNIIRTSEQDTDEPNGVEVRMPVSRRDYSGFRNKAQEVFKRFPVLPKIDGTQNFELEKIDFIIENDLFKVRDERVDSWCSNSVAIQGLVAYPIDKDAFSSELSDKHQKVLSLPLDIKFPLGQLNITASRERLNYDKRTEQNIKDMLDKIYDLILDEAQTALNEADTLWKAKLVYGNWLSFNGHVSNIRGLLSKDLKWGEKSIKDGRISYDLRDIEAVDDKMDRIPYATIRTYTPNDFKYKRTQHTERYSGSVEPDDKVVLLWDDEDTNRGLTKLMDYHYKDTGKTILIIKSSEDRLPDVLKALGNPPSYDKRSELEEPPREFQQKAKRPRVPVKAFYELNRHNYWYNIKHDAEDGGIYVITYNGEATRKGKETIGVRYTFEYMMDAARKLGIWDDEKEKVIGIQATYKNIPDQYDDWVHIEDVLLERFKQWLEDKPLARMIADYRELEKHHCNIQMKWAKLFLEEKVELNNSLGKMSQLLRRVSDMQHHLSYGILWAAETMHKTFDMKIRKLKPQHSLEDYLEQCKTFYPLLKRGFTSHETTAYAHYVDLCDANPSFRPKGEDDDK